MKAKTLLLVSALLIGGCVFVNHSISAATKEVLNVGTQDKRYIEASDAMDSIYKSIEVLNEDLENGVVTISIENPSNYSFQNMMVHMEFVNKNKEAYYVETAFVFEGLKAGEKRELEFVIQDLNMLNDLDWFNFCTEGF